MGREIPERIPQVVGFNLTKFRQMKRWTQTDAAKRLGVSVRQIQRWEAGWNMTIVRAAKLALFYGWPTRMLFEVPRGRWLAPQPGRPRKALVATVGVRRARVGEEPGKDE